MFDLTLLRWDSEASFFVSKAHMLTWNNIALSAKPFPQIM